MRSAARGPRPRTSPGRRPRCAPGTATAAWRAGGARPARGLRPRRRHARVAHRRDGAGRRARCRARCGDRRRRRVQPDAQPGAGRPAAGARAALVVALNMVDLAARRGLVLDANGLAERLGVPVVATVARSGQGSTCCGPPLRAPYPSRPADLPAPECLARDADRMGARASPAQVTRGERPRPRARRADRATRRRAHAPVLGAGGIRGDHGRRCSGSLFALATVPMDLIEATFAQLGTAGRDARCPTGRCATWCRRASSAASPARWCSCRRSACCSS